jgi:hypothetical protein
MKQKSCNRLATAALKEENYADVSFLTVLYINFSLENATYYSSNDIKVVAMAQLMRFNA